MDIIRRPRAMMMGMVLIAACSGDNGGKQVVSTAVKVPLWPMSTKSDEARKHAEAGERLADAGYFVRAHDEFTRAVAADSSFAYAYLRVAENGFSNEEYATNVARAQARIAGANPTEALLINIDTKRDASDIEGTLALAQQLTVLQPANPRSWLALGLVYQQLNKFTDARPALQKAIDADTTYALSRLILANDYTFFDPRDFGKAEQLTLEAVKLWPNEPVAYNFLGAIRRAQGRMDDAIAAYTKQIALDSSDANAFGLRGNANVFAGHLDAARADHSASMRRSRPAEIVGNAQQLAFNSAYEGKFDATLTDLRQLEDAIPGMHVPAQAQDLSTTLQAEFLIAIIQKRFDVASRAVSEYAVASQRMVDSSGSAGYKRFNDALIAYYQGMIAAFQGNSTVAKAKAVDITRIREPDKDPGKLFNVHMLLGANALAQKDYAVAVKELEQGDPTNTLMLRFYLIGLAQEGAGHAAEAKAAYQRVVDYHFNNPDNGSVHFLAAEKLKIVK